jgi:hypothetical protein
MEMALEKSDSMFRPYAYPGHVFVEFLIIREVSFQLLIWRNNPDIDLARTSEKTSKMYKDMPTG